MHKYDIPETPLEAVKEPTPEPPPIYTPLAPGTIPTIEEEQQAQLLIRIDSPSEVRLGKQRQIASPEPRSTSSSSEEVQDALDQAIRNSPITTTQPLPVFKRYMATQTQSITQTSAGPDDGGSTAIIGTAITAAQAIQMALNQAMRRNPSGGGGGPSGSRGSGGPGGPGGPTGGGGGRGPPGGHPAPIPAPQAAAPAQNPPEPKPTGDLPTPFEGNRELAEQFIDELEGYFLLNHGVQCYRSPLHKTAFALTLLKGKEVSGWARDMRAWVASLDPVLQDIPEVWETFVASFNEQYADTQAVIRAQSKLDELKMTYPHVDKYITDFEELARKAGYNQTSEETKHHFLQGISGKILEDVLRAPQPTTYAQLKSRTVESTRTKIILENILGKRNMPYKTPFRQNPFSN